MTEAADITDSPSEVLVALARLSPKHFDESCAAFAKVLRVSGKALRTDVLAVQATLKEMPFPTRKPADAPVDLSALLTDLASLLKRHIIISEEQADAIALWIANTYVFQAGENCPLLIVNAPERACGKTLVLEVVAALAHRPMTTANATPSTLFRFVDNYQPTVFIDEADTFFAKHGDMHGMVNAGHKKQGAQVWRTEKVGRDALEPKVFNVFCPKAIAGIALEMHLPDATMSRGLVLNMRRKLPEERVERWRYVNPEEVERLTRGLAWFGLNRLDDVKSARPILPDELSDRDQDNWQPLLAIAKCAGPDWEARALKASLEISGKAAQPESTAHELLRDIASILEDYDERRIPTQFLLDQLHGLPDTPWATYNRGEKFTARQLSKQLATYGIRPKTVRTKQDGKPDKTPKGYEVHAFRDAVARYLSDQPQDDDSVSDPPERVCEPPQPAQEPPQTDSAY